MRIKTKPWGHQLAAYEKFKDAEFGALLMEMGLGKTKTAIDLMVNAYDQGRVERVLLICPSALKEQWSGEQLESHHAGEYKSVVWESSKSRTKKARTERKARLWDDPAGLKWLIVNVEAFSTDSFMRIFSDYVRLRKTAIVIDESTQIKNPSAKRTENIRKLGRLAAVRFILTGTLITGSPYDAWSPFDFLKAGYWDMSYFAFRSRYGIEMTKENPFSQSKNNKYRRPLNPGELRKVRSQVKTYGVEQTAVYNTMFEKDVRYIAEHPELNVPYKHMPELKAAIESAAIQVRKEDALDLPPKVYTKLDIEMSPEQRRVYKELKEHLIAEHRGQELTVANKLSLVTRLQQVAGGFFPHNDSAIPPDPISGGNPKLKALIDELEDNAGTMVVIWARFTAEIRSIGMAIEKELPGRSVAVYHGGVTTEERGAIVSAFKAGEIDTLVLNQATGRFGLNLQVAHTAIYYSQGFGLEDRLQSEDRIHRAGQKISCTYLDLVMKGTVDQGVREVLKGKRSLSEYFADHSLADFIG